MITLLNTSILTNFGSFSYKPITVEEAERLVATNEWQSAIGHQATAEILTELLKAQVPVNRIQYSQNVGDVAVVFKLKGRAPEGIIFNREEIEAIGYEFGTLERTE